MYNIKLSGLDTDQEYYVKVRAKVNGLETSEWSLPFKFRAPKDTMPPGRIENLSFLSEGDSFVAKWDTPSINEDGSPCADVSHFELELRDLDRDALRRVRTSETNFSMDFNQNKSMFGQPAGKIELTVRAVDLSGNIGKPVDAIAQNPPPEQVKNVKASSGLEAIHLSWTPNEEADLKNYEVHVGSTSNFTPSEASVRATIAPGNSTFLYDTSSLSVLFIKIIAADKFNQKSIPSDVVSAQPRLSTDYDKEPPGSVSGLSVEQSLSADNASAIAYLSFNSLVDQDLDKYEVQYRKTGNAVAPWSFTNIPSDQSSAEIGPLPLNTDYDFRIRAVDYNANKGLWSAVVVADGVKKTSLPPAPTGVTVRGGLTNLMITWDASTDPSMLNWAGTYEVQASKQTSFAQPMTVKTSGTLASFMNLDKNTVYYVRVRSVDPYSNTGAWSTTVSGNTGTVESENASQITWSPTAPSQGKENDLWIKTPENAQYRYVDGKWESAQDVLLKALESQNGDLVINGSGTMGSNYNFAGTIFDPSDTPPGAPGAFRCTTYTTIATDQIVPLNPNKKYKISLMIKNPNPAIESGFYAGLSPYDAEGLAISVNHYAYLPNTTTTLAMPVANGDTQVHLTSSANWYGKPDQPAGVNGHYRSIIVWNYVDGFGKTWEPLTYSRNSRVRFYEDGGIDPNTHVITLNAPWDLGPAPAGTVVSAATSGEAYMYSGFGTAPTTWEERSAILGTPMKSPGTSSEGRSSATVDSGLPPGAAGAKIIVLPNHSSFTDPGGSMIFSNVSVSDASAAYDRATSALASSSTKNKNIYSVNPASGTSLSGYSFIDGDTWYQKDGDSTIVGMWEFMNGLWNAKALNNQVIANLDAGKITSGYIDADRIAGKTITGEKIAAGSIVVGNIAQDTIDHTVIKDGAITTGKIAAESVTAEELAADSVIADKIKAGEITGDKLTTDLAVTNRLKVKSAFDIEAGGHIKSTNYTVGGNAGFYMDDQQLVINQGKIKAAALEIQDSQNLLPASIAAFGSRPSYYDDLLSEDGAQWEVLPPLSVVRNGVLTHRNQGTSIVMMRSVSGDAPPNLDSYLHLSKGRYIYSASIIGDTGSVVSLLFVYVSLGGSASGEVESAPYTLAQEYNNRVQLVVDIPEDYVVGYVGVKFISSPSQNKEVNWHDLQVERVVAGVTEASPWTPPGFTAIDGESITTGEISSSRTIPTANGDIALWSINTNGNARFADAVIDGKLVVGGREGADNLNTYIQSDNYSAGNAGWAIKGDGDVEFNNGLFRGKLSLERSGVNPLPLKMTASVSDINSYVTQDSYTVVETANIRGTTYGYDRDDSENPGVFLPTIPNLNKRGNFFIGPTTEKALNIQVHDGGSEDDVYLSTPPKNVTVSRLNIGEQTDSSRSPLMREDHGLRYQTYRSDSRNYTFSGVSTENIRNETSVSYDSITREKSPLIPERIAGEVEYPESIHEFRSSVVYETPTQKNLMPNGIARATENWTTAGLLGVWRAYVLSGSQGGLPTSGYAMALLHEPYVMEYKTITTLQVPTAGLYILSFYVNSNSDETVYIGAQVSTMMGKSSAPVDASESVPTGMNIARDSVVKLDPDSGRRKVSFYFPDLPTGMRSISMHMYGPMTGEVHIWNLQFEHAAYKNDASLPEEIRDSVEPTPWTLNGVKVQADASFKLQAVPFLDPVESSNASWLKPGVHHDSLREVGYPAEAVINLSNTYESIISDETFAREVEYKFSTAGLTFPGTKTPYLPTGVTIDYDYDVLATGKPVIGNNSSHLNLTPRESAPVRLSNSKRLFTSFSRDIAPSDRLSYPGWITLNQNGRMRGTGSMLAVMNPNLNSDNDGLFVMYMAEAMDNADQSASVVMQKYTEAFGTYIMSPIGGPVINMNPSTGARLGVSYDVITRQWTIWRFSSYNTRTSLATGSLTLPANQPMTLTLSRAGNTVTFSANGTPIRSVTDTVTNTGKHVGMIPRRGGFLRFSASDSAETAIPVGKMTHRVNVNNGNGLVVERDGAIYVGSPGYYALTASITPSTVIGNHAVDHFKLAAYTSRGVEINLSSDTAQLDGGILGIHGSSVAYLDGSVTFAVWTNDAGASTLKAAQIQVVRIS